MEELQNQVVIVTGSGNGIGKGIATCFAQKGAAVVIATIDASEGAHVEKTLNESTPGQALFIQTDVASEASVQSMIKQTYDQFGKIDTLVNNAGITVFKSIEEATLADWENLINIDLRGPFLCSKYVIPYMKEKRNGSIINISSNHALATLPNTEIYAAAKGGVNAMTRSMALSLGADGIRVNAICPGFTNTPHYQRWLTEQGEAENVLKQVTDLHAVNRISEPEDIGKLALYLASEDAAMVTGECMVIDGGLSIRLYHSDDGI